MTHKSKDHGLDAAMMVISAMNSFIRPRELEPGERERVRRKEQYRANAWENLRLLLGLLCWQYLLLPVGIRNVVSDYGYGDKYVRVTARQLHIFGIRVARWVVKHQFYSQPIGTTRVLPRRYRLRSRGRR